MSKVERGDTVWIHYTGKLQDGTVFGTSRDKDPLKFTVGKGEAIAGLENAVLGMAPGESKTVEIGAAQAFGGHRRDMVIRIDGSDVPDLLDPQVGQHLLVNVGQRQRVRALVTDVSEEGLTLDTNHPLAGKDLIYELEVLEIA